ncbi:unnamed protein product [Chrysodeixis includens]|uniref:MICOS complex subunit MIC10 n=1 Tax=Chrysodeixis includens TaxID=689277 RepID=A0A9N8KST2_CHRIL|nr:unnamed protein product [Chrysodeixis includens]
MDGNNNILKDETFVERVDLCISDIVFKSGCGLVVGTMLEKFVFIGHRWPHIVGIAVGMSHAWALCRVTTLYRPNSPFAIEEPYEEEVQEALPEDI